MQDHHPTAATDLPVPAPALDNTGRLPPAASPSQRIDLRFVGSGSEYFRIWIVNLLLTAVTLGLYYPVAKLRRLRYFYGSTEVGGQPLSFHAQASGMLKGYLLVAALLGAYSLAGHLSPTAGLVAFVLLAAVWPALWHSSMRFRAANTGWRGLRLAFLGQRAGAYKALLPGYLLTFGIVALGLFDKPQAKGRAAELLGSGWFGLCSLGGWSGWGSLASFGGLGGLAARPEVAQPMPAAQKLVLVLLGLIVLALPWLYWLLRRYQQSHFALAAERTQFKVGLGAFYSVGWRIGLLSLLAWVLLAALFGVMLYFAAKSGALGDLKADEGVSFGMVWRILLGGLAAMAVYQVLVRPYVMSRMQNLVWNGTHSQHLRFESDLRLRPLMGLTLKNWLLMVLSLGLYFPFAAVALARMRLQAVTVLSSQNPDEFLADLSSQGHSAAGDAAGDLLGLDIGL
jgi:uncharacterized membrane protein YjgN (DUF898 family)